MTRRFLSALAALALAISSPSSARGGPTISVKETGAKGDGIADDTASVNAGVRKLVAGGSLIFPPGVYRLSNVRLENLKNVSISGPGATIRWFGKAAPGGNIGFELVGTCSDVTIHNLTIVGDGIPSDRHAGVWEFSGQILRNIRISNCHISNVVIGISLNANLGGSIRDAEISANHLEDIVGTESGEGYGIHLADNSGRPTRIRVIDNVVERAHRHSIYQGRGLGVVIRGNTILAHRQGNENGPYRSAVAIARSSDCTFTGNTIKGAVGEAIGVDQDEGQSPITHHITIANNVVENTAGLDLRIGTEDAREGNVVDDVLVKGNVFDHQRAIVEASVLINSGANIQFVENDWRLGTVPNGYRIVALQSYRSAVLTRVSFRRNKVRVANPSSPAFFIETRHHACDVGTDIQLDNNELQGFTNLNAAVHANCGQWLPPAPGNLRR